MCVGTWMDTRGKCASLPEMPGLRFLRHSDKVHSAVSVSSKAAVNSAAGTISIIPPIVPMSM